MMLRRWHTSGLAALLVFCSGNIIGYAQSSDVQPIAEWRAYRGSGLPAEWTISDGVISHISGGGDLVSAGSFANAEITFEWKISPGGNSGVFYRVDEQYGAAVQSGPEYQILDNAGHPDGQSPVTSAASAFGLYAPPTDLTKPVGNWNAAKIVLNGNHVEHWLNGEKVVSFDIGSADWKARVAGSKFAAWPAFGALPAGHIVLQDHGSPVEYRNFMVRGLPD
ncbi:MAG: DUF1080 domain-containing protein [Devosia sp.]